MKNILITILLINFVCFSAQAQTNNKGYIVKIGDKAPDFSVKLTDGTTFKLSENLGKVVVIQFTASWCGVCLKEMPHIEKDIWLPFKEKEIVVLAMDRDEPDYVVKNYQKKSPVTYPFAIDTDARVFNKFAVKNSGVTRNVVIDKNGKIAYLTRLYNKTEFLGMVNKIKILMINK